MWLLLQALIPRYKLLYITTSVHFFLTAHWSLPYIFRDVDKKFFLRALYGSWQGMVTYTDLSQHLMSIAMFQVLPPPL
jgi:hypothetical protein